MHLKLGINIYLVASKINIFIDWFVLGFSGPLENFSLIWRRHHCRWRATNFDLCSALMAIEQWGIFNVPHLLWHGQTLFNDHLRGPVIHTCCRAFDSGAIATFFNELDLSRPGTEPDLPHARRTLYLYATATVMFIDEWVKTQCISCIFNNFHRVPYEKDVYIIGLLNWYWCILVRVANECRFSPISVR